MLTHRHSNNRQNAVQQNDDPISRKVCTNLFSITTVVIVIAAAVTIVCRGFGGGVLFLLVGGRWLGLGLGFCRGRHVGEVGLGPV